MRHLTSFNIGFQVKMNPLLLRLFGIDFDQAGRVTDFSLQLRNGGALGWFVVLAIVLAASAWALYRRSAARLPAWRRHTLIALRVTLLCLLILLLLRPVLMFTVEGRVRRMLVCLMDTSASMKIQDPRLDDADLRRAAIGQGVLDARLGLDQSLNAAQAAAVRKIPRVEILKSVLRNEEMNLLPRLGHDYDVSAYSFGQVVKELGGAAWVQSLDAQAHATALGDAVRDILNRTRGQPLAGIFIATDGGNNSGSPPASAAAVAQSEGVPLYIYGVGITSPRDIIVSNLFTPEVAFANDTVAATVRVRGQGLKGESGKLELKLGDDVVARQTIEFTGDEQVVALNFKPGKTGEFPLTASIAPRDDEAVKDNNTTSQRLRIIDSKIKVLLIEQSPRWEFRYLLGILLRDVRMEMKCVLLEGDPSIAQADKSPYLDKIPDTKEALFKYDLIIIGDVDPKAFSPMQLDSLSEYVSKFGGALVMLAGKNFNPSAYAGTPLAKLLPVELEGSARESAFVNNVMTKPIPLELTPAGRTNKMMQLSDREDDNIAIWKGLPPIYWDALVGRAKPAAEVLLTDPDPVKESRGAKMPVLALQQYGLGQVLFAGTDNFWRWRRGGETYHQIFWSQVAQRMALPHLLGTSRRTLLSADKQNYATGDRVAIYARLYKEGFEPYTEATVRGSYTIPGTADTGEVQLRALPDQPGMYRGEFVALRAGTYHFTSETDPKTVLDITATEPQFEAGDTAMNEPLLRKMAEDSGGAFFREEDLFKLPDAVSQKAEKVRSLAEAEIWSSPIFFMLILAVATAEWILRRMSRLK